MWGFILGMIVGAFGGIVVVCICAAGDDPCEDCIVKVAHEEIRDNHEID